MLFNIVILVAICLITAAIVIPAMTLGSRCSSAFQESGFKERLFNVVGVGVTLAGGGAFLGFLYFGLSAWIALSLAPVSVFVILLVALLVRGLVLLTDRIAGKYER